MDSAFWPQVSAWMNHVFERLATQNVKIAELHSELANLSVRLDAATREISELKKARSDPDDFQHPSNSISCRNAGSSGSVERST